MENKHYFKVGDVVCLSDRQGHHFGIVLHAPKKDLIGILLVTKNPYWNKFSRLVKDDEKSFFPMLRRHISYFAPVFRPIYGIHPFDYSFPEYRVKELQKEFPFESCVSF